LHRLEHLPEVAAHGAHARVRRRPRLEIPSRSPKVAGRADVEDEAFAHPDRPVVAGMAGDPPRAAGLHGRRLAEDSEALLVVVALLRLRLTLRGVAIQLLDRGHVVGALLSVQERHGSALEIHDGFAPASGSLHATGGEEDRLRAFLP